MKTSGFNLLFVFIALFSTSICAQTTELIISEYGEGDSWNKYIEIYNGTGADIDLAPYTLNTAFNGSASWTYLLNLTGVITNGDVFVLVHPNADPGLLGLADQLYGSGFNGDDVVGLFKNAVLIDAVGSYGVDPGLGWDVAGTVEGTYNHTLVRKPSVCAPNTNWASSAGTTPANSEWIVLPNEDWSDIGSHSSTCGGIPVPVNQWVLVLILAVSIFLFRKKILR